MRHADALLVWVHAVKPAPFSYHAASSVRAATAVLAKAGDDAAVLAGGQSLLIEMRYRRVRPALVLDINRVAELGGLRAEGPWLHVGALARHRELERAAAAGAVGTDPLGTLLKLAATHIAHPPIRTRGTFAGSIAWAHPAAEWCALAVALSADIVLASATGTRSVPADQWFTGRHRTARKPDELVTGVRLPLLGAGTGAGFAEHRRTHGSFALAAALATVQLSGGRVTWARIGLANAAEVPLRARQAEQVLAGQPLSPRLLEEAAEAAAAAADPAAEPHCSAGYRRHVLRVLTRRSLMQAAAGAQAAAAGAAA